MNQADIPVQLANMIVLAHKHAPNTTWMYNISKRSENHGAAVWFMDKVQLSGVLQQTKSIRSYKEVINDILHIQSVH